MHRITITRSDYDFDADQWLTETVCSFIVGPRGIEQIDAGAQRIPRRVAVLDIDSGESVTLESDPERWAELLPSAFRSGDLTVTVDVEQPVEIETRSVENRQPVRAEALAFQAIRH